MSFAPKLRDLATGLVVVMMAVVLASQAAMAAVCGGQDLIAKLEIEKPAVFQQIADKAAEISNGEAMLWKIDGNGANTASYLLGTIHMTDERVATLSAPVKQVLGKVSTVALEIANVGDKQAIQAELGKRPDLMILQGGSLWDHMSPSLKDIVAERLEAVGIPRAVAGKLQPWLPAVTLAASVCETKRGQAGHPVLDQAVEAYAKSQGAEIVGLESAIEQFAIMSSMPIESQIMFLTDAASMRDQVDDFNETLIQAYLKRRVTWFIPFTKTIAALEHNAARQTAEDDFMSALIDKRNVNMAERAGPLLSQGSALIAVGALHLPGKTGLVALFRKQGFTVTAVD